jgi:quercetin dioxygenase-like cupin family protein
MDREIQVRRPTANSPREPLSGLSVRPVFQIETRQLLLLEIDAETSWGSHDGTLYGWVRDGRGFVTTSDGESPSELTRGDFLRLPADTVHRYTADGDALEILAVVDGQGEFTAAAPPRAPPARPPTIVGPDNLVPTVESPGLRRETPFPDDEDVLVMRVEAAGGAAAGWHHHGENTYFGYAVDGPSETESRGAEDGVARIELGECFHVPSGLVHRDTNPTDEPHTGIVWLCGGAPWVVNVGE